MEWNQISYSDKSLMRNGICMKNEIVQIGAVKMNSKKEIIDCFESVIKPDGIKKMNKAVSRLTGITDEMLEDADGFETVLERFKAWCGEEYVFLIWGFDDIRILVNNIKFHGLDVSWLPPNYNAQVVFCKQNNLEKRQYALSFALEYCKIDTSEQFHDALNDAEYTARVLATLDLENGLSGLNSLQDADSEDNRKDSFLVRKCKFRPIKDRNEIWGRMTKPSCPFCGGKMTFDKAVSFGKNGYNIKAECPEHGGFAVLIRLILSKEETWNVYRQIYILNDRTKYLLDPPKKKSPRRRRRRRSSTKTQQNT